MLKHNTYSFYNSNCSQLTRLGGEILIKNYFHCSKLAMIQINALQFINDAITFIVSIKLLNIPYNQTSMINPSSPFVQDIKECKQTMRKLRKKIYKHSISTKNKAKKNRDSTEEIINIFRSRNIPEFVA